MDVGMKKVRSFNYGPAKASVFYVGQYGDGSPVYDIEMNGKPGTWARLTVFVMGAAAAMEEGDILVKTWSENTDITNVLRKSGLFVNTGRRIPTGFVNAEIWRWKE